MFQVTIKYVKFQIWKNISGKTYQKTSLFTRRQHVAITTVQLKVSSHTYSLHTLEQKHKNTFFLFIANVFTFHPKRNKSSSKNYTETVIHYNNKCVEPKVLEYFTFVSY